jgi:DNA-directed RNA polymerase subunit RPC12/RpoP
MEKRFAFKCWNCKRKYTLFKGITNQQELIVPCPFCNAEGVVKLEPYKKEKKTVLKGDGDGDQSIGYEYQFPEVIPTQKPE